MNDKIFEYLRTNFADLGLSKEILSGYADLLAATVTSEDGIAAAVETIKPLLQLQQKENDKIRQKYAEQRKREEQPDGGSENGNGGKKNGAESEDGGDKKPQKRKEGKSETEEGEEIPKWAQKLIKDMSDFKAQQKNRDRAVEIGIRRKEITQLVSKLPKSVQRAYDRMDLDIADDDYSALKEEIGKEVDDAVKELSTKRAVFNPPYSGQGGGEKEISKEKADEIAKSLLNH